MATYGADAWSSLANCILWGDSPDEIEGLAFVLNGDVQGGTGQAWFGEGCIDSDPMFADAEGRLSLGSPCIDAGGNQWVPADITTDLDGKPRIADGDVDGVSVVDMGAYETPGTVYVPADYATIQAAIDAAVSGYLIEVAPGTYNEAINFLGKTIRLYSTGGPEVTTINGAGHFHVVQCESGEGPDTILEGFTITGGNANGSSHPDYYGGGMYNYANSPTVKNCIFTGNSAIWGGGMYNHYSSPTVTNCTFSDNSAISDGGGMYSVGSSPIVTNCTFSSNPTFAVRGGTTII